MNKNEFEFIMDMAIASEIEAYQFYSEVVTCVSDPSLKQIFQEFAAEEKGHQATLENLKTMEIQNFTFTVTSDYKISEATELPRLSLKMKPAEAVALAMKKEEESMKLYRGLAAASADPEKKKLFDNLAKMEEGHKTKMEGLYTMTAFPEAW